MLWIVNSNSEWHIGDSTPDEARKRVVTFQADGHELEMIQLAMEKAYVGAGGRVYFSLKGNSNGH